MTVVHFGRRSFLMGIGGALAALPVLESLMPREARADGAPPFLITYQTFNGVQQRARFSGVAAHTAEPEGFWPSSAPGAALGAFPGITEGSYDDGDRSDRAVHELRGFESDISVLRGVRYPNTTLLPGHTGGRVMNMTGSSPSLLRPRPGSGDPQAAGGTSDGDLAWGRSESFDVRAARELGGERLSASPNGDPALWNWRADGSRLSGWGTTSDATQRPWDLYNHFFAGAAVPEAGDTRARRRRLVTESVHAELRALQSNPRLSAADRVRLSQHFDALRAVEVMLTTGCMRVDPGAFPGLANMRAAETPRHLNNEGAPTEGTLPEWATRRVYPEATLLGLMEVIALAAGCGAFRTANIVFEPENLGNSDVYPAGEHTRVHPDYVNPNPLPTICHAISHRALTNDGSAWNGQGVREHHLIDRWHLRRFRFLLEKLRAYGALDQGVAMYTNEIGTGAHDFWDVPYILAGNCQGRLRTGRYYDFLPAGGGVESMLPNNKLWNTVGAAMGLRNAAGRPLDDFGGLRRFDGDEREEGGGIPQLENFSR